MDFLGEVRGVDYAGGGSRGLRQLRLVLSFTFALLASGASAPLALTRGYFLRDESGLSAVLKRLLSADASTSPEAIDLGFVHRKLGFADVYFLANTGNHPVSTTAIFRAKRRYAEWWDPVSGEISPVSANPAVELYLQPYESRVLVLSDQESIKPPSPMGSENDSGLTAGIDLESAWTVTFPALAHTTQMHELQSWTEDPKTRFYSGQAIYEKDFAVPADQSGSHAYLEFGPEAEIQPPRGFPHFQALLASPVREVAQVFLNGQSIGWLWKPPYRLDGTSSIRIGQNHLKIFVYNLAINALAGRALPDYRLLNSLYGQRFNPQDMENLEPLPSGLFAAPRLVIRRDK